MEVNEILRRQILETVDNQVKADKPRAVNETIKRLKGMGYTNEDAKVMVGQCLAVEIFEIFKQGRPFDELRYVSNLNRLPEEPA